MTIALIVGGFWLLSRSTGSSNANSNAAIGAGLARLGAGFSQGLQSLSKALSSQQKSSGSGSGSGGGVNTAGTGAGLAPSSAGGLLGWLKDYAGTPTNLATFTDPTSNSYIPYLPDPTQTPVDASSDPFLVTSDLGYSGGGGGITPVDASSYNGYIDPIGTPVDASSDPFLVTSDLGYSLDTSTDTSYQDTSYIDASNEYSGQYADWSGDPGYVSGINDGAGF